MTFLQLVNAVLKKLREPTVTTVTETAYSTLIGEFINDAKEEVEDSWDWTHLRQDVSVATVASTSRYAVTGLGERFTILQALNITQDSRMFEAPYDWMKRQLLIGTQQGGSPIYYNFNGVDSNQDPYMDVSPVPDAVETITFNAVVRQAELTADGDVLLIPSNPVILGAYYRAVEERGEDQGDASGKAEIKYRNSWSDAVARDAARVPDETTWQVD